MPFGPKCEYADFQDCVRKNQEMGNPEGYCAKIQQATEQHCKEGHRMSRRLAAIETYKSSLFNRLGAVNPRLATELREFKLPWYTIRNVNNSDSEMESEESDSVNTEIYIYDEIGGSFGVSASEFIAELNDIDAPSIDIRINSPGGDLFDSIAIHNAIVKHPAHITVYVDSLAASGASLIAVAGDDVVMMRGSQMMIHDALANTIGGNPKDHEGMAVFLHRQSNNIAEMYADKGGGTAAEWRERMSAESWFFATEAVDIGLANRVYVKPDDSEEELETQAVNNIVEEQPLQLLQKKHSLTGRGYKYAGRKAAPPPQMSHKNVIEMSNIMKSIFG